MKHYTVAILTNLPIGQDNNYWDWIDYVDNGDEFFFAYGKEVIA